MAFPIRTSKTKQSRRMAFEIDTLLKKDKDSLIYEYDFGDGWEHKVVLEKIVDAIPDETVPRCIMGRRDCPPEDVGGTWGYETKSFSKLIPTDRILTTRNLRSGLRSISIPSDSIRPK